MANTEILTSILNLPVFSLGERQIYFGELLVLSVVVFVFFLFTWLLVAWRNSQRAARNQAASFEQMREAEQRMNDLVATQNELTGRLSAMNENLAARLESMSGRIGQSMSDASKSTQDSLAGLKERLTVIDSAQQNITSLTGQVVELQNILANKQSRGAFGEAQMQAIVQDSLPIGSYQFQAVLSTGLRPDCLIPMPNRSPALAIDAKFPLEAWNAIRAARVTESRETAEKQFRQDMGVHIKSISEKYRIPGETQDTAIMFVPSESIFAEIHEKHDVLIQQAYRARVLIVSPSLLMLAIQVIQSVLKDARMREQSDVIQSEVIRLMDDVTRLDARVRALGNHFGMAQNDITQILTSTERIAKRGELITNLDFGNSAAESGEKT